MQPKFYSKVHISDKLTEGKDYLPEDVVTHKSYVEVRDGIAYIVTEKVPPSEVLETMLEFGLASLYMEVPA